MKSAPRFWDGAQWRPAPPLPTVQLIPSGGGGSSATVTTITSIPTSVLPSTNFTISGTVKTTAGANVTGGQVQLEYSVNGGASWTPSGTAMNITAGTFSKTTNQQTQNRLWRAVYDNVASAFLDSTSPSKTTNVKVLTSYTKTYSCNGTRSYDGDGSNRGSDEIYQGYISGVHDRQRSIICFPTTVATDLTGAYDIQSVELYLKCLHWGPDSGGTAVVRSHSETSPPSTWGGVSGLSSDDDRTAWSSKTGAKWCDVSQGINSPNILSVSNWSSGAIRGLALYPTSDSAEYYGYFAGNGQSGEPQLRITYRKYV